LLATLPDDGRRGTFFEEQLIAAFKILQNGVSTPQNMTGSLAGAMGHTNLFQRHIWTIPLILLGMLSATSGPTIRQMR
jgi:hypothetical protein